MNIVKLIVAIHYRKRKIRIVRAQLFAVSPSLKWNKEYLKRWNFWKIAAFSSTKIFAKTRWNWGKIFGKKCWSIEGRINLFIWIYHSIVIRDHGRNNSLFVSLFVCRYNSYIMKITFYLTFKSEENLSQINDSKS